MIKSYTAFTNEVDDLDVAVSEIIEQLNPEKNCLKSTAAMVFCYYEFAVNGIVSELYKRLGFPIIGTTTSALATNHSVVPLSLAILMMTSDDVIFTAASSSSLSNELEHPLEEMYQRALIGHDEFPKLILSTAPLMLNYAGDHYVQVLDKISGGVPNFGTLAVDDSDFNHCFVIYNDKQEQDIYSVIVASGNIVPRFIYESFSPRFILSQTAVITKSHDNLLEEVNGLPFLEYMDSIGLEPNDSFNGSPHCIPFILDYTGEGIPVSRVLLSVDEAGNGVCGGCMPEGKRFNIGTWDKSDVIGTTTHVIKDMMDNEMGTIIAFSCNSRSYILGADILLEANKVNETIADKIPYLFAYSAGEICPVMSHTKTNSFHNNTVIACAF